MTQLFNEGRDFHAETAQMFGLANRIEAKPINFGMIFGQGPRALAREVNTSWKEQGLDRDIDAAEAGGMIRTFFERYGGLEPYFKREYEKLVAGRKMEKVLRNPLTGRVRRFHMRKSDKLKRIMKATLLQQIESHLLKIALIDLNSELKAHCPGAKIVMAVHDSIWIEAPHEVAEQIRHSLRTVMVTAVRFRVPLEVDLE